MKTALVTGATGPLSSRVATSLATAGFFVYVNYRTKKQAAEKLAKKIGGGTVHGDITKISNVKKIFKKTGPVDVLINGVGAFIYKPLAKTSEREFVRVIENNLFSAWFATKAALPGMRRRKRGIIINFGSAGCNSLTARPFTTPYYIAKTGLVMLTRSLAAEEKNSGIKLFAISPGVLPHGVRPPGAPVIPYKKITDAVVALATRNNKKPSGSYIEISGGWRPR